MAILFCLMITRVLDLFTDFSIFTDFLCMQQNLEEDSEMLVSSSDVLVEGPQPMQGLDCCHVKYSRTLLIWYMNQPKFFPPEDNSQRRNQLLLILS
ncbi:unnamed protein product [Trifolium pratense]|uniref:Uncharacterized protein n=1 Tax=Trifolium pratense TaxID=57577 RepID=A0ACB0MBD2_TRIPR|nr:unnamed protein product [Trifolium pratense]